MKTEEQIRTDEVIDQAQKYFKEHRRELMDIYRGRWVIIYDNHVVDSDVDEWELVKRAELRGRFDLKYATPMFKVAESSIEHIANQMRQERQLADGIPIMDGFGSLEEVA